MPEFLPEKQRRFAERVIARLRAAKYEAYLAGGCVRDELLGRLPKDFDVATDATPQQIRHLFGRKKTLAIGAAFGVITVLGPEGAGMVEVTTFRQDAAYSDGRHPDHVTFSSAEEDASRRDFTINGLFFDPIEKRVIDFVGGRDDLARKVIRAIGEPQERFSEDKLRMLRAVRFAAAFGFHVEDRTMAAIREMAEQITVVSPERIAMEMRRMLVDANRAKAVGLMIETGLASVVLPEIVPGEDTGGRRPRLDHTLAVLEQLAEPTFPLALGALLHELVDASAVRSICRRWRLSNQETALTSWLVEHRNTLADARSMRWSVLQPILITEGVEELLTLQQAVAQVDSKGELAEEADYCRTLTKQPAGVLDPPPLLTGDDLQTHGIAPGPVYKGLLQKVRDAQLDKEISNRTEALALVDRLRNTMIAADQRTPQQATNPGNSDMDKKAKKRIQTLNQRIQKLHQQLAGSKQQLDDPEELDGLKKQLAEAETELAKIKAS